MDICLYVWVLITWILECRLRRRHAHNLPHALNQVSATYSLQNQSVLGCQSILNPFLCSVWAFPLAAEGLGIWQPAAQVLEVLIQGNAVEKLQPTSSLWLSWTSGANFPWSWESQASGEILESWTRKGQLVYCYYCPQRTWSSRPITAPLQSWVVAVQGAELGGDRAAVGGVPLSAPVPCQLLPMFPGAGRRHWKEEHTLCCHHCPQLMQAQGKFRAPPAAPPLQLQASDRLHRMPGSAVDRVGSSFQHLFLASDGQW